MCFPVNIEKFLRTAFYRTHPVVAGIRALASNGLMLTKNF